MAFFHYTDDTTGFVTIQTIMADIVTKMTANGFELAYPATFLPTAPVYLLKASTTVDPLSATQPWYIRFEANANSQMVVIAGTNHHLDTTTGDYTTYITASSNSLILGLVGLDKPVGGTSTGTHEHFVDRRGYTINSPSIDAYPMAYSLSISAHGVALAIWEPGLDDIINRQSWLVVQRPVNCTTGLPLITGKAPVFCTYGIQRGSDHKLVDTDTSTESGIYSPLSEADSVRIIRKFVVREYDVLRPYHNVNATSYTNDFRPSVPPLDTTLVSFMEDGSYNINVIGGLNTSRFNYPLHELDLLAYTSADVLSTSTIIPLSMYGETNPRNYRALCASNTYNTGISMLIRSTDPI